MLWDGARDAAETQLATDLIPTGGRWLVRVLRFSSGNRGWTRLWPPFQSDCATIRALPMTGSIFAMTKLAVTAPPPEFDVAAIARV